MWPKDGQVGSCLFFPLSGIKGLASKVTRLRAPLSTWQKPVGPNSYNLGSKNDYQGKLFKGGSYSGPHFPYTSSYTFLEPSLCTVGSPQYLSIFHLSKPFKLSPFHPNISPTPPLHTIQMNPPSEDQNEIIQFLAPPFSSTTHFHSHTPQINQICYFNLCTHTHTKAKIKKSHTLPSSLLLTVSFHSLSLSLPPIISL